MKINIHNYEYYFTAYSEGKLDEASCNAFEAFMAEHPELWDEQDMKVSSKREKFTNKNSLKKPVIDEKNCVEYFVRSIDNELTVTEKQALEVYLFHNPELKKELAAFEKTVLVPEKNIQFENKNNLKKAPVVITEDNYREYIVLDIDNELNELVKSDLAKFIATSPEYQKEQALYKSSVLANNSIQAIIYPGKAELKAIPNNRKKYLFYTLAIAASLLILFGLSTLFTRIDNSNLNGNTNEVATNTTQVSKKSEGGVEIPQVAESKKHPEKATTKGIVEERKVAYKSKKYKRKNEPQENRIIPQKMDVANSQSKTELQTQIETPIIASMIEPIINKEEIKNENSQNIVTASVANQYVKHVYITEQRPNIDSLTFPQLVKGLFVKNNAVAHKQSNTGLLYKLVEKITNKKVQYIPTYNEDNEVIAYNLEVPALGVSRYKTLAVQ